MAKSILFPYGITLRKDAEINIFPAAEVWFQIKGGEWTSLFLILDSGASISALPKSDALAFGIETKRGKSVLVGGIGGKALKGWRHEISIRLDGNTLTIPVVFIDNNSTPRVLGRAGIFDKFSIVFEEKRQRTGFLHEQTPEHLSLEKLLNEIDGTKKT